MRLERSRNKPVNLLGLTLRCVQFDFGAETNHNVETMSANKLAIINVYPHTNFGINPTNSICVMTKTTTKQPTNTVLKGR